MLSREEYEERRRQIDQQHESAVALLEAGRLMQIRALDLVWLASGAGGVPLLPQIEDLALGGSPVRLLESGAAPERTAPPKAAAPEPPPRRRQAWGVIDEISAVFERLPEVFDHHDLNRALGRELDRGAARRNLQLLIEDGVLAPEDSATGRFRLRYRKLRESFTYPAD